MGGRGCLSCELAADGRSVPRPGRWVHCETDYALSRQYALPCWRGDRGTADALESEDGMACRFWRSGVIRQAQSAGRSNYLSLEDRDRTPATDIQK